MVTNEKITATQVLFPVALLSFVMVLFLGYQTSLLVTDRNGLHMAHTQQDRLLEQAQKLKGQLNALAIGTLKLSDAGNKDAQNIIAQLKKAGIDVSDKPTPPPGQPGMAPAPGSVPPGMPTDTP